MPTLPKASAFVNRACGRVSMGDTLKRNGSTNQGSPDTEPERPGSVPSLRAGPEPGVQGSGEGVPGVGSRGRQGPGPEPDPRGAPDDRAQSRPGTLGL